MNVAIVIAIEHYTDPGIPARREAVAGAQSLANAWEALGFAASDRLLLLDGNATKSIVESKLRRALRSLEADDTLFFYYAGHSFTERGQNYFTCGDSQLSDLEATSLSWKWLGEQLQQCDCQRVAIFLDTCDQAVCTALNNSADPEPLSHEQLEAWCELPDKQVCCLVACAADEESRVSRQVRQSIWTHHLLAPFTGDVPQVLNPQQQLTADALQAHLQEHVARTLTRTFADVVVQTPQRYGKGDFVLADLAALLAERQTEDQLTAGQIQQLTFSGQTRSLVKRLAGFRSTHSLPETANARSQTFIASLAKEEIQADLDGLYEQLKQAFRFKRQDVQVSNAEDGGGSIMTPYFNYAITMTLDAAAPTEIIWRRTIDAIKEPERVTSSAFAKVFGKRFDTIEIAVTRPIDLPALIDQLEALDDDRLQIEYDREVRFCRLTIKGLPGTIHFQRNGVAIVHAKPQSPQALLKSFFDIQNALVETNTLSLLPF